MELHTVLYILCIAGFLEFYPASSECRNSTFISWHGSVLSKRRENITESCNFTFLPPDNRTDLILSLKLIHYYKNRPDTVPVANVSYQIKLPDGDQPDIPQRYFTSLKIPWCGLYVSNHTETGNSCQSGLPISTVCSTKTKISQAWPAQVTTKFKWFLMVLHYEFIECLPVITPTTLSATAILSSEATRSVSTWMRTTNDATEMIYSKATFIPKSTSDIIESSLPKSSDQPLIACLGSLLALAMMALVIAVVKYWKLHSIHQSCNVASTVANSQGTGGGFTNIAESHLHIETRSTPARPSSYTEEYTAQSSDLYAEIDRRSRRRNEPVDSDALQRSELVDNVLYGCTSEKEEVVNELYNL